MTEAVPLMEVESDVPDQERLRQIGERVRKRLAVTKSATLIHSEKAELWAVANFLSPDVCERLITMIDAVAQPSRTYAGDPDSFRTSWTGVLTDRDALVRQVQRKMDALLGFDRFHAETMQGQRYLPGQQFKPHTDWFPQLSPAWPMERDNGGQRSFTAMVYLNHVTDGGETDFPHLDLAVSPRQGVLLAWNNARPDGVPNPFTIHAGAPVGSGAKYVITRWYRCGETRQVR